MNRFNLEDRITAAWSNTEEDIENILHAHFDSEKGPMSEDELMNALSGLKQSHNLRMERLWETFEQIIKDKSFEPVLDHEDHA